MSPATVLDALRAARAHTLSNTAVLDHIATPHAPRPDSASDPPPSPSAESPLPISKHVLSAIFAALDRPASGPNHVFVENNRENHFLYGLVLPLIARVFAVSCPGLLTIVQLPRSDIRPEWATPSSDDGYGSNGSNRSNRSKSNAATTPSFVGNSRTPSPSDDDNSTDEPKTSSPEPTRPSQLLKNTNSDPQHQKHQQQLNTSTSEPLVHCKSPSPDTVNHDYRALRLICNGFEVLTGKMPPPQKDMGRFTLANVGWEKAGVVQPSHPSRGISMSFSNGMVTPTEGIVVTFSNGSLCLLTLWDPLSDLHQLKVAHDTPVMVFSFATAGHLSVGELICKNQSSLTEAATRVKAICDKPNFMFVEIGHGYGSPTSSCVPEQLSHSLCARQQPSKQQDNSSNSAKPVPLHAQQDRPPLPRYIPIDAVPRAIPLFVNTINQCFIDPPYQDIPEHAYENALINDRYCVDKQCAHPNPNPNPYHPKQNEAPNAPEKPHSEIQKEDNTGPPTAKERANPNGVAKSVSDGDEKVSKPRVPASDTNELKNATSSKPEATNRDTLPHSISQNSYPAMYGYYGYRPDHAYPTPPQHGPDPFPSRVLQHPVEMDRNQLHPNHAAYFLPHPSNGVISNGPYAPQPGSSYHAGAYYPTGHGLHHQVPETTPGWHHGIPPIPHGAEHMRNPHLVHAGREGAVAYAAHHQFQPPIGGQFPPQYYVVPPSSQIYGQTPATTAPHPKGLGHPHSYVETYNGMSHAERATTGGQNLGTNQDRRPASSEDKARASTATSSPPRRNSADEEIHKTTSTEEGGIDEEKEKALQVLVGMREGSVRGKYIHPITPKESIDALSDTQKYPDLSQQAPANEQRTLTRAPQVYPDGGPPVSNTLQTSPGSRVGLKRKQRKSDTQSSSSANSQGTMLMKGVVTGSSHGLGQDYTGWKQKRPRQR